MDGEQAHDQNITILTLYMNTVDHGEHVAAMRIEVESNQNKWELDKVTLQCEHTVQRGESFTKMQFFLKNERNL